MNPVSQELVDILNYLLPGFIAAAIFYNLTPAPRPQPFERVVQALIYTVIIQVIVLGAEKTFLGIGSAAKPFGEWNDNSRLVSSVVVAMMLGVGLARAANSDTLHRFLRWIHITHQTSYSSEWYGAFSQNTGYVVLHMSGKRRLYGWPEEWPSTPNSGHFVIVQAEWLVDHERTPLDTVEKILVDVSDVEIVEFMGMIKPTT